VFMGFLITSQPRNMLMEFSGNLAGKSSTGLDQSLPALIVGQTYLSRTWSDLGAVKCRI